MFFLVLFLAICSWTANAASTRVSNLRGDPADNSSFRVDYQFYPLANGWLKLHRIPAPWSEARLICLLEGAHLASPITEGLAEVMEILVQEAQLPAIHSGIQSMATVEDYISSEGVPLSHIPVTWAANQPDNLENSQRCLAITPEGTMDDADCKDNRPFLCYKKKDGVSKMNGCGYHDKAYQVDPATGHCYKLHVTPMTWHQGLTTCSAEGGHLAVINSNEEVKFIMKLAVQQNEKESVFLGFYSWYPERRLWQTLDGKLLKEAGFERWRQGQPNNLSGQEHCGSFNIEEVEMRGSICNYTRPFICEIPPLTEQHCQC